MIDQPILKWQRKQLPNGETYYTAKGDKFEYTVIRKEPGNRVRLIWQSGKYLGAAYSVKTGKLVCEMAEQGKLRLNALTL